MRSTRAPCPLKRPASAGAFSSLTAPLSSSRPIDTISTRSRLPASSRGLGYLLQFAQSTYNAALSIALIVLIMTFVMILFAVAEQIEHRLLRWRYDR